jgi:hypothetical protein
MTVAAIRQAVAPSRQRWRRRVPAHSSVDIDKSASPILQSSFSRVRPELPWDRTQVTAVGWDGIYAPKIDFGKRGCCMISDPSAAFPGTQCREIRDGLAHCSVLPSRLALRNPNGSIPRGENDKPTSVLRYVEVGSIDNRTIRGVPLGSQGLDEPRKNGSPSCPMRQLRNIFADYEVWKEVDDMFKKRQEESRVGMSFRARFPNFREWLARCTSREHY